MKYISTRGEMTPANFCDVLLEGLAPDGGLVMPVEFPQISAQTLEQWRKLSYSQLATEVMSLYITDIPKDDLAQLCAQAYNDEVFSSQLIVPLVPLKGLKGAQDKVSLVGLSEGPTLAFKDMAMQFLGQIFEYVLTKQNKKLNILGATSGDTGSAAEYAMRGKQGLSVFMLSPYGRMSSFQRAQMYSLLDDNIHNIAVHGVFDDCQDIVKNLGADAKFKEEYHLGAVNSINWARICAQVVYYFWAWLRATSSENLQSVSFCVPTGNFGNIMSGYVAKMMGLPIKNLVLATNENNVLAEFFSTGIYRPRSSEQTFATSSPSMDISKASNFERFIFILLQRDSAKIKELWNELASNGSFDLSQYLLEFEAIHGFVVGSSDHQDRLSTIKDVYQQTGILIDPHTADGVAIALKHIADEPMLVLETALPAKFDEVIHEAIGQHAPIPPNLQHLLDLPQRVVEMDCDTQKIKEYMQKHALL